MSSAALRYFVVDAFTDRPFAGNPAAVVLLPAWPDIAWLQNVAMEMNLSETAFLVANIDGFDLRWFTPTAEVDLCGHATLASAVVLSHLGTLPDRSCVKFSTRSGILGAERHGSRIWLDFPALSVEQCKPPAGLLEAIGVSARSVARGTYDLMVEVDSLTAVRKVAPDFPKLAAIPCRGVIVTAAGDDRQHDFVSRFFAPSVGIDEDPVTGSAHCMLGPFWGERLGKSEMTGYQASARGGVVYVKLCGPRVMLGGYGVIFASGELPQGYSDCDYRTREINTPV